MTKAILIIDMPIDCLYCPCYRQTEYMEDCKAMVRPLTVGERDNKPSWCPLKPIPKKLLILGHYQDNELLNSEEVAYAKGRNDLLDEILGGKENG